MWVVFERLVTLVHQGFRLAIETTVHEELRAAFGTTPYEP